MDNITVKSSGNTIKLQSTPEEVTGGYFDSEEVWHEFGGGGETEDLFQTLEVTNNTNYNISIYGNNVSTEDNKSVYSNATLIRPSQTTSLLFPFADNAVSGITIATRVGIATAADVSMLSATLTVDEEVRTSTLIATPQLNTSAYKALYFFARFTGGGNTATLEFNYS